MKAVPSSEREQLRVLQDEMDSETMKIRKLETQIEGKHMFSDQLYNDLDKMATENNELTVINESLESSVDLIREEISVMDPTDFIETLDQIRWSMKMKLSKAMKPIDLKPILNIVSSKRDDWKERVENLMVDDHIDTRELHDALTVTEELQQLVEELNEKNRKLKQEGALGSLMYDRKSH
eukprot:CAMPEP_0171295144 /NCGR_PEP_ID=MMETSP0816-20121228/3760_1 /TAXON_ID=420281 /ORGANISM="Proboscia inermis, Strain CCAP1064/1" /LENGTH=179 /DNA_ID=CAMNT_0011767605 /DNA_START=164 /DNA_END=703 /DNA_ORIENTATION=+